MTDQMTISGADAPGPCPRCGTKLVLLMPYFWVRYNLETGECEKTGTSGGKYICPHCDMHPGVPVGGNLEDAEGQ